MRQSSPLAGVLSERERRAALCMEPHDVVLAKCAAGRERDWDFAREAIRAGVVDGDELVRRADDLPLPASQRRRIARLLGAIVADAG